MKITVISYSLTGNNEALAASVAAALGAEHIKISEPKRRTIGTIVLLMPGQQHFFANGRTEMRYLFSEACFFFIIQYKPLTLAFH